MDAQARDGFVTLTGTVEWHYQREAADARAAADAIGCAFRRDAMLDADRLSVEAFSP
jgi:hypothetical protein